MKTRRANNATATADIDCCDGPDDAEQIPVTACVHECPTEPNKGKRIRMRPIIQTWLPGAPVIPGRVWCWTHRRWEESPEDKEAGQ